MVFFLLCTLPRLPPAAVAGFYLADDAAADLFTGAAGGLCGKIVGQLVDDDTFSADGRKLEALVKERQPGISLKAQKGNQISCVVWVVIT